MTEPTLICQDHDCGKHATFAAIATNAPRSSDNIGETHTCDEHLIPLGLTVSIDHPSSSIWTVWRVNEQQPTT